MNSDSEGSDVELRIPRATTVKNPHRGGMSLNKFDECLSFSEVQGRARNLDEFQNAAEDMTKMYQTIAHPPYPAHVSNGMRLRALLSGATSFKLIRDTNDDLNALAYLRAVFRREPIRDVLYTVKENGMQPSIRLFAPGREDKAWGSLVFDPCWLQSYSREECQVFGQWLAAFYARYPVPLEEVVQEGSGPYNNLHATLAAAIVMSSTTDVIPLAEVEKSELSESLSKDVRKDVLLVCEYIEAHKS